MFALEPIVAKTVLPILGGTPMVWNTCVLFFQILLLAGYAYAHGVTTWLGGKRSSAAYVVLLVLPFLTLPFAVGPETQPPADGNPIGWLLLVLAKSIGLPFFALAATAPILQRWFADTDHPAARDPYFLYAASNLGSLLALVAYPLVIEPMLPLRMQNQIWAVVYGAFVLAACLSVAVGWRFRAREGRSPARSTGEREEVSPSTAAEPIGATPDLDAPCSLGGARLHSVEPDARGHDLLLDRHRAGPAVLDRAAGALSPDVRRRVQRALRLVAVGRRSVHAAARAAARGADDRRLRSVAEPGDSAAPRGLYDGRARLSRTARRRPAGAGSPDGVLLLDRVRRHARRPVQHAGGAGAVQPRHRVPAGAGARAGRPSRPPDGDRASSGR